MFVHNLNPILINFGFLEIRWYSLAYIFGIIIGWILGKKIIEYKLRHETLDLERSIKFFEDLISYIVIATVLGGRIGYILFYNFSYYLENPIEVFKIWQGGMSFHGALLGIILATYIFSNKEKIRPFFYLDVIACVAPIGLFFGRIANFINAELYGKPTTVMWSVIFPNVDNIPRHPSQLYEALLEGIVLFSILASITFFFKKARTGICSSLFLILYGIFRIFAEQFREPDEQVGYLLNILSMGSTLSILMIIAGVFIFLKVNKNEKYK
jgi:phosphatidylglycerol:prolipoprotein diacylglycerol transferase